MHHVTLNLSEVRPSRFRDLAAYPLDAVKVDELRGSIRNTAFWEDLPVRETSDGYELIFGHHRMAAALEELGPDFAASFAVHAVDDDEALRRMADENSDVWATDPKHVALIVSQARARLDAMLDEALTWEAALAHPWLGSWPQNFAANSEPRCVILFGPEGNGGPTNLAQAAEKGVGRETISAYLDMQSPKRWMGKVETGLNMIGSSPKREAANIADAAARLQEAAAAQAEVDKTKASGETVSAAQVEIAEKARIKAEKAQAKADRDAFVKAHFHAGVIPAGWNMYQAKAFFDAVTGPFAMSLGGLPLDMLQKLVDGIEKVFQQTGNGTVPARKGVKDPAKAPLTAASIKTFVADYLDEVDKTMKAGLPKEETPEDPQQVKRAVVRSQIQAATAKVDQASRAIAALTSKLLDLGEKTEDFAEWLAFNAEVKSLSERVETARKVAATPHPTKAKGGDQKIIHLVAKETHA